MSEKIYSIIKNIQKDETTKLSFKNIDDKIAIFNIYLSNITINELLNKKPKKLKFNKDGVINLYKYNGKIFIYYKDESSKFEILLVDNSSLYKNNYLWLFILFLVDISLVWFYYFLFKKLKPLIKLKNEINKFSDGNLEIDTSIEGDDEIAQVSNEFNNAIEKIRELNSSRKLFLRNILHELKTPITKGKLVSDTLDNGKKKDILPKSFFKIRISFKRVCKT